VLAKKATLHNVFLALLNACAKALPLGRRQVADDHWLGQAALRQVGPLLIT